MFSLRKLFETHVACESERVAQNTAPRLIRGRSSAPKCALCMFLHIPKTGGSSVSGLLQSLPDWHNWYHFRSGQPLFFATVHEVFGPSYRCIPHGLLRSLTPNSTEQCGTFPDWRAAKIFVEFHGRGQGLQNFFRVVLPNLEMLRGVYAAAGCPLLLMTVLRDPPSHLRSLFSFFHVYGDKRYGISPRNSSWLVRTNEATQAAYFADFLARGGRDSSWSDQAEFLANRRGLYVPVGSCDATSQAKALALLNKTDLVGDFAHLREFMWMAAARLGYWLQPQNGQFSPMAPRLACNAAQHPRLLDRLPTETRRLLEQRSRCSRDLYRAAVERDREQRRKWVQHVSPALMGGRPVHRMPALRTVLRCREWSASDVEKAKLDADFADFADTVDARRVRSADDDAGGHAVAGRATSAAHGTAMGARIGFRGWERLYAAPTWRQQGRQFTRRLGISDAGLTTRQIAAQLSLQLPPEERVKCEATDGDGESACAPGIRPHRHTICICDASNLKQPPSSGQPHI